MGNLRQVIIGNGVASISAIKAIRQVDRSCSITVISAENCNAYSPVLLTYYLKGQISREHLFIVDSSFYRVNNIKTKFGIKAEGVDALRQTVQLEDGGNVGYDNLLIATGACPVSLVSPREKPDNVFSLRTIEDAERILECVKTAKEVVLIEGGLVNLQIVDALFREGIRFTIVELARQVLYGSVDADCAAIIKRQIESQGVSVLLGERVTGISKRGNKAIVTLASGGELVADMVIVGIGVRPDTQFLSNSGVKVDRGILVDELMRTNIHNIFAAGDVSEGENLVTGKKEVLPNWINACKQGRIAGVNMSGKQERYEGGLRDTIVTIFGLTAASVGLSEASNDDGVTELAFSDSDRKMYMKIMVADNRIVGIILLGRTGKAGMLRNLLKNRKEISTWKGKLARNALDLRELLPALAGS